MSLGSHSIIRSNDLEMWDVVVVGAGAAGLMTCLELPSHLKVLLLNGNQGRLSSSRWAQGGMAAVVGEDDSLDSHIKDTLNAGAGLCDADAVRMFVNQAPKAIESLQQLGMEFDKDASGNLARTLEAAHSFRRVLHVKDSTGKALTNVLVDQVNNRANICHQRGTRVTQLLVSNKKCQGVQVLKGVSLTWIYSKAVVLATGGGGHLFANTTNPPQACGEGIALAWKAGATIENLEFVQFHPTALHLEGAPCFLLSEALRGEGAILIDQYGNSPIANLKGGNLASRDQVSKALVDAMKKNNVSSFGLDLSPIPFKRLEARFPHIIKNCRELGLDPFNKPIPVAPAAHYWMGGIATNLDASTTLPGLYAVGEVASTGLHGANRLASNSLMECIIFAKQMASINYNLNNQNFNKNYTLISKKCDLRLNNITSNSLMIDIKKLRDLCWAEAGVKRSFKGMQNALEQVIKLESKIEQQPLLELVRSNSVGIKYDLNDDSSRDLNLLLDLHHRQIATKLMLQASLFRKESRGGHFRNDFQMTLPYWQCHSQQRLGKEISTRPVNT